MIALLGSLVPDAFPAFPVALNDLKLPSMTKLVQVDDDLDIQVGPLRR